MTEKVRTLREAAQDLAKFQSIARVTGNRYGDDHDYTKMAHGIVLDRSTELAKSARDPVTKIKFLEIALNAAMVRGDANEEQKMQWNLWLEQVFRDNEIVGSEQLALMKPALPPRANKLNPSQYARKLLGLYDKPMEEVVVTVPKILTSFDNTQGLYKIRVRLPLAELMADETLRAVITLILATGLDEDPGRASVEFPLGEAAKYMDNNSSNGMPRFVYESNDIITAIRINDAGYVEIAFEHIRRGKERFIEAAHLADRIAKRLEAEIADTIRP